MAVKNSDSVPEEFFPGIASAGSLAPGSTPSRTPPPDAAAPDSQSGVPGSSGASAPLSDQQTIGRSASTAQPGQEDTFDQGEESAYTDSGASSGSDHADAWPRYSWQQSPGRK